MSDSHIVENIILRLPGGDGSINPQYRRMRGASTVRLRAVHYDDQPRPEGAYDPVARYTDQANYHIAKDWDVPNGVRGFGLMYQFRVSGDGRIWQTQPIELITWSVTNANPFTVSTCLDCGQNQQPTQEQLTSLLWLLDVYLPTVCPNAPKRATYGHGELTQYGNSTSCPGAVLSWVKDYRKGGPQPMPDPQPTPGGGQENPDANGFFAITGHSIGGAIAEYWAANGGVAEFGYPLSQEYAGSGELAGFTVQVYERAMLQWKPGEAIQRARIGAFYQAACEGNHDCACEMPLA